MVHNDAFIGGRETFVPDCPSMDIDAAPDQSMVQLLLIVPLLPQPILLQNVLMMTMMSLRRMPRTMMMTMRMMIMTMKTNDDEHKADNEDPPAHLMSPPHSIHPPPQIPTYPIVISENPALEATIIITSILLPCPSHQLHQLEVAPQSYTLWENNTLKFLAEQCVICISQN